LGAPAFLACNCFGGAGAMDLRGEEGESCIAAEESKCNRLAS
jgi:hypothetical protein